MCQRRVIYRPGGYCTTGVSKERLSGVRRRCSRDNDLQESEAKGLDTDREDTSRGISA